MTGLGLGTAPLGIGPLGGLFEPVSPPTARATVDAAWDLGVRLFDTAPLYGAGLAEERLGAALADRPRNAFTVSTKVGRIIVDGEPVFDYTDRGIRRSLGESLARLGLAHVDIALLHDPEAHMDAAERALDAVRPLAARVGVGTNYVATASRLVERAGIDVLLIAGRYTLLDRSAGDELLPLCLERGVTVLAAGVFNSGVLAGGSTFDYGAASPDVLARCDAMAATCARYGVPLAAAAIQFPLRNPAVSGVVVGARSPAEIEEDARLLELEIPEGLWHELTRDSARAPR